MKGRATAGGGGEKEERTKAKKLAGKRRCGQVRRIIKSQKPRGRDRPSVWDRWGTGGAVGGGHPPPPPPGGWWGQKRGTAQPAGPDPGTKGEKIKGCFRMRAPAAGRLATQQQKTRGCHVGDVVKGWDFYSLGIFLPSGKKLSQPVKQTPEEKPFPTRTPRTPHFRGMVFFLGPVNWAAFARSEFTPLRRREAGIGTSRKGNQTPYNQGGHHPALGWAHTTGGQGTVG